MTAVATGFITLLTGLAGVAAMVLAVYVFSYAIDRLSCFESAIFTAEELEARRYASTVVIKAKLAGLLTNERDQVFRTFFERQSFPFRRDVAECGNDNHDDNETIVVDLEAQQEGDGERKDDPNDRNETEGDALEVVQPVKSEDDDAGGPSCSICLNIYGEQRRYIVAVKAFLPFFQQSFLTPIVPMRHNRGRRQGDCRDWLWSHVSLRLLYAVDGKGKRRLPLLP